MQAEQLAQRSREVAAENDRVVLAAVTGAGDLGTRPGTGLAEATGLPARTVSRALERLEQRGLVAREGRRRVWATAAGRSESGGEPAGLSLAPTLDTSLAYLPAEALRAFARLQLCAVPARWHLADQHATGWCGFIAPGPTKTGKTSIAALVCRLYGIDPVVAIPLAQDHTPGSLIGRRERDVDAPGGYRLERSPLLALPYLCVDEWDKAPRELRVAAGKLLQGNTEAELEGKRVRTRPTIYVTLNTGRDGLGALHEAHIRRSVVIDTGPLRKLLEDVDEAIAQLFAAPIPRLSLERLRPPASELPGELRGLLRAELKAGLTDEGWQLSDVEPLARVALGRAALTSGALEHAALATVLDYLTCAATLGHARPGFAARLGAQLGSGGPLEPDPAAAEGELERRRRRQATREHEAMTARRVFVEERAGKIALARQARDAMGRARDVEREKIAAALSDALGDLRAARTLTALQSAWATTEPYIARAHAWRAARDAAAEQRARLDSEQRQRRDLERRQQAARGARAVPAAATGGLAALRNYLAEQQQALAALPRRTRPASTPRAAGNRSGTLVARCSRCDRTWELPAPADGRRSFCPAPGCGAPLELLS